MGGWMGGSVGQWMGSGQMTKKFNKSGPNWDNSILFEDLWFVETPAPMSGCMDQWVGSGQMTNLIKFELINIIWLYNLILFEDTYGCIGGFMGGLMSNDWNQINLDLMEIIQLWTFWTFYLNHLSPLWGYFCTPERNANSIQKFVHKLHKHPWLIIYFLSIKLQIQKDVKYQYWYCNETVSYHVHKPNVLVICCKFVQELWIAFLGLFCEFPKPRNTIPISTQQNLTIFIHFFACSALANKYNHAKLRTSNFMFFMYSSNLCPVESVLQNGKNAKFAKLTGWNF